MSTHNPSWDEYADASEERRAAIVLRWRALIAAPETSMDDFARALGRLHRALSKPTRDCRPRGDISRDYDKIDSRFAYEHGE